MRPIDADAMIADMQERYCKPCKERKEDYNGVKCRACWVDDAMDEVDGFADNCISTKQIKYYDEDEKVWKIGEVIVNSSEKPNNSKVSEKPTGSERSSK